MMQHSRFMADQQQRAVENQMRGEKMAEEAMESRARFGMAQQAQQFGQLMQQAKGYADYEQGQQQFGLKREMFEYGKEQDASELGFKYDALQAKDENYEKLRESRERMAEMQREGAMDREKSRREGALEVQKARFSPEDKQNLSVLDRQIAGVQDMIDQAGVLGKQPQMMAELTKLQLSRAKLVGAAVERTENAEFRQAQELEKDFVASQPRVDPNGVPRVRDPKTGKWEVDEAWKIDQDSEMKWADAQFKATKTWPSEQQIAARRQARDRMRGKPADLGAPGQPAPTGGGIMGFGNQLEKWRQEAEQRGQRKTMPSRAEFERAEKVEQAMPQLMEEAKNPQDFVERFKKQFPDATESEIKRMVLQMLGQQQAAAPNIRRRGSSSVPFNPVGPGGLPASIAPEYLGDTIG